MKKEKVIITFVLIPILLFISLTRSGAINEDDVIIYEAEMFSVSSMPLNRVIFSSTTNIEELKYDGIASYEDQLLGLSNEIKPVIEISNTTNNLWELSVSYSDFLVNGVVDNHLRFAYLDFESDINDSIDNSHIIFEPNTSQLIHTSTSNNIVYSIAWDNESGDLIKLHLPAYRHDLKDKEISSTITWQIELTPSSGETSHIWGEWNNHIRSCIFCDFLDSHIPTWSSFHQNATQCWQICTYPECPAEQNRGNHTWGGWSSISSTQHRRHCTKCGASGDTQNHSFSWHFTSYTNATHQHRCGGCGFNNSGEVGCSRGPYSHDYANGNCISYCTVCPGHQRTGQCLMIAGVCRRFG
ncbi:MAG: hypothetical protein LBC73_11025 [Oscillospiraceae bacterium]|jgi:hypothetical protein|nr:hypothetical protein [Oscillospiraceae bacterium]